MMRSLSLVQEDVAEVLYRTFWLKYVCVGLGKHDWLMFDGTRMRKHRDGVYIRGDLSNVLIPLYRKMRCDASQKSLSSNDEGDQKGIESLIAGIGKIIKKLGTQGYRSAVITMSQVKFFNPDFEKWRDSNANLTGWRNCVIECCGKKAYVRPGKPEDCITMSTGTMYRERLHWKHPLVEELMKWFGQVFVDRELMEYVLRDFSSFLIGKNAEKIFRVYSGDGDNSKSMICKILQKVFGMYCIDFPVDMLTVTKGSRGSGPNPELAQTDGTHIGIISEPDADNPLECGKIKRYTGGDRFFARNCNQDGGSMEAMFKMILQCNRIPDVRGADKAFTNRLRVTPFLSTWTMDAPDSEEERYRTKTFQMDPFFDNRLNELSIALAWVLVQKYPEYKTKGLKIPKIVKEYTESHLQENDPYLNFVKERIKQSYLPESKDVDVNASVTATELYPVFKNWFRDNYPGEHVPKQTLFKFEMLRPKRLGPQGRSRRWHGVKIIIPIVQLPEL